MGKCAAAMLALIALAGCASAPRPAPGPEASQAAQGSVARPATPPQAVPSTEISAEALGIYRTSEQLGRPPSEDERAVIESATTLLGKAPNAVVVVKGKRFVLDCIGTVSAVYYRMDIDITKDFARYPGNGVNRPS